MRDPRDAVIFAQAGRRIAPTGSAALVRSCALEARTQARRNDLTETERVLSRAEQVLNVRSEPQTGSFFSFDAPYLPYYAGTAYAWLGETAQARNWASQAIELCATKESKNLWWCCDHSRSRARLRDSCSVQYQRGPISKFR
ncbi:MAG: hypothetical protein ACRDTG_15815 [Pseudonocardiaceae bacterium]